MNNAKNKLLSLLLVLIMTLGLLPAGALASEAVVTLDEVRAYLNIDSERFGKAWDQNKALEIFIKDTDGNQLAHGKTDVFVDAFADYAGISKYKIKVDTSLVNPDAYNLISSTYDFSGGAAYITYNTLSSELTENNRVWNIVLEKRAYDVTFLNDGATFTTQTIPYGDAATAPTTDLEKEGFTFQGWFEGDAKTSFDFSTPITGPLTLSAKWEKNAEPEPPVEPTKLPAWFFVRTDGLVPLENGNTGYPTNEYLPAHGKPGAMVGTVTKESSWTTNYGYIQGDTLNGEKLSAAFADVQKAIANQPNDAALAAALSSVNYNPEAQGVIWYVVKNTDKGNQSCPGYHVDGVLYTKGSDPTQVRVLNYFSNIPGNNQLLAYSVHGLGTDAVVGNLLPTRAGYDFMGWSTAPNGSAGLLKKGDLVQMDADQTLYAQWRIKTYAVTYSWTGAPDSQDLPANTTVNHGDSYTVDAAFTDKTTVSSANGTYTFSGWNKTGTISNITAPVSITGSWTYQETPAPTPTTKVEIWHFYNDGIQTNNSHLDEAQMNALGKGGIVERTNTTITGEYINGLNTMSFYTNPNNRDVAYHDYQLWAYYTGSTEGTKVTVGQNGYVDLTDVTELRIHLNYYQTRYKVVYDANGGASADQKTTFETRYNTANEYTILDNQGDGNPNFVRDGHTFTGWAKNQDGSEPVAVGSTGAALTKDETVTYYAQWRENQVTPAPTYSVTYQFTGSVPNGVTPPVDGAKYEANAQVTLAPAPAAPANYTFQGWTLPEGLTLTDGKFAMPEGGVTVTGNWTYTAPSGGGETPTPSRYTVTVNYLEQNTNKVLATPYVSARLTSGSSYDVSEYTSLAIDGYAIADVDGATSGTLRRNVAVNVYYTADASIPDENPPLGPGEDGGTDIPDVDVPTAPDPGIPDENVPTVPEDDTIIKDEDAPLGDLPQTGATAQSVDPALTLGLIALAASMAAAGLTFTLSRKKEEEN